MHLSSMQLVCTTMIAVVMLYLAARPMWMMKTQDQHAVLIDKLIRQRNDVSRRLNELQVNFYLNTALMSDCQLLAVIPTKASDG